MRTGLKAEISLQRDGFSIELALAAGPTETVALLGPNGAGKSTVAASLAGLLPITHGEISLDGRVFDKPEEGVFVPPEDRGVGVVFQGYLLFEHMTVSENVGFGLTSRGVDKAARRQSVESTMERFGLSELAGRKARDLSGGQAQRVALARTLITSPNMLVLDEPTASLDVTSRTHVRRQLVDDLSKFKGPRLLITHDPMEAFLLADVIYIIEEGRITQSGSAEDIRLRPRTPYVADLVGSNLVAGVASGGDVAVGGHVLHVGDTSIAGDVIATIHPRAIAIYPSRPDGSPRNTWVTVVGRIEHYGDRVRLLTDDPLPLTIEVTPSAVEDMALEQGSEVWVSVKATEIG
ncbi:MAG: ABC transporter ATP-binding protein, partial [Actinomycetota bacterium]|nr:ABC transporter ATP-binding protein [Actinomycetota bacterium]